MYVLHICSSIQQRWIRKWLRIIYKFSSTNNFLCVCVSVWKSDHSTNYIQITVHMKKSCHEIISIQFRIFCEKDKNCFDFWLWKYMRLFFNQLNSVQQFAKTKISPIKSSMLDLIFDFRSTINILFASILEKVPFCFSEIKWLLATKMTAE